IGIETTLKLYGLDTQGAPHTKPVVLIVLGEDEDLPDVPAWARPLVGDAAVVLLAPRGSGPNRFTRQTPINFVPRAHALLGRTVDEGRVWDIAANARWLQR